MQIHWTMNHLPKGDDETALRLMREEEVQKARNFHASFPQYAVTPLARLDAMAEHLGLGHVFVKDESYRFGLNAFKVLGGSYAMARFISQKLGRDALHYATLTSKELKNEMGDFTFFTATDGNHGRGVAWAANKLGQKSVVYMPKGSSKTRLDNILAEGAEASITDMNYDDAVRLAAENSAKTPNSVVVQDTAWEGYTEIPGWIMQGYGTMALEALEQLRAANIDRPTHIFIQAGVGSLAGAVQGFFANMFPENPPTVTVVEASAADCLYKSAEAADGKPRVVGGDLNTIQAGLACGEPNIISFDILRDHTKCFVSLPDWVAAKGMRLLAAPIKGDGPVTSGESGAGCMGLLYEIMKNPDYAPLQAALKLDENSTVLLFSTEGDTDPDRYRSIVWDGNDE